MMQKTAPKTPTARNRPDVEQAMSSMQSAMTRSTVRTQQSMRWFNGFVVATLIFLVVVTTTSFVYTLRHERQELASATERTQLFEDYSLTILEEVRETQTTIKSDIDRLYRIVEEERE